MNTTTETSTPAAQPDAPASIRAEPTPCCGGPAPDAATACCALDAEVKSTGGSGCGCTPKPAATKSCC